MAPFDRSISNNSWRPIASAAVGLPKWIFALILCFVIAPHAYAHSAAADVPVARSATEENATNGIADAAHKADIKQIAEVSATAAARISIVDFDFTPNEINIVVADSVTWSNDDGAPHGLAFSDGAPGTDLLLPGATFSRRFDRPGTYNYNCTVHPYMTGRVVVRAK